MGARRGWVDREDGAGSSAPIANLQGSQGEGRSGRSRHGASAKGATWCEAAAQSVVGHGALASCGDLDVGSAQVDASALGSVNAAKPQAEMVSDASCQKTRECVLPVEDECANDAHDVANAASERETNARAVDSGSYSPESARTRAVFGSKAAEPAGKAGSLRAARISERVGEQAGSL